MDEAVFNKIKAAFERRGGVIASSSDIDKHLDSIGAEASTLDKDTILIRSGLIPSTSAVYEELIHTSQYKFGRANGGNWIEMEIEAKEKLLKYKKQYGISDVENKVTIKHLRDLRKTIGGE